MRIRKGVFQVSHKKPDFSLDITGALLYNRESKLGGEATSPIGHPRSEISVMSLERWNASEHGKKSSLSFLFFKINPK